jgi:hypothetical protein
LAFLLLYLLAGAQVLLTDENYEIAPWQWRRVEFVVKQQPVALDCWFQVISGGPGVQVELMTRRDVQLFAQHKPHESVTVTAFQMHGAFRQFITEPGEYALVVLNSQDAPGPATVRLRISEDFSGPPVVTARYLSPGRRLTVIVVSFAFFFAIVSFSARRLLRTMKQL